MIDMAQADSTLRKRTRNAVSYDFTKLAPVAKDLKKGEICVIREYEILRIVPQWSYKEWVGCFSWLGVQS